MNTNAQDTTPPPLLVKVKNKPSDPEWREVRARTVEMLPGFTPGGKGPGLSRYGGRLDKKVKATGFFRVEKIKDRWWMVAPDGYLFVYVGVNSVAPGSSAAPQAALKEKFGDEKAWARAETKRLREMGFNGSGAWSDWTRLRAVELPERLAYSTGPGEVASGNRERKGFMRSFAGKFNLTRPGVGHSLYPNNCMPVFHPEFEAFCDEYAKAYAVTKDDPWLVGHFTDNELPTPRLEKYLGLNPDDPHMGSSYRAAKA